MKARVDQKSCIELPLAAQANVDETGCDPLDDLEGLASGHISPAGLLEHCLRGAEADRVAGWHEYVAALVALAEVTPAAQSTAPAAPAIPGMRVKVDNLGKTPTFGMFLGLIRDERGDVNAVVRQDHYGFMLAAFHPSRVTPVTPEEEETYKP